MFLNIFIFVACSSYLYKISSDNIFILHRQQLRNLWLRTYLTYLKKEQVKRVANIYNHCKSKIYDIHLKYYSLSEEEKDFMENIVSLLF